MDYLIPNDSLNTGICMSKTADRADLPGLSDREKKNAAMMLWLARNGYITIDSGDTLITPRGITLLLGLDWKDKRKILLCGRSIRLGTLLSILGQEYEISLRKLSSAYKTRDPLEILYKRALADAMEWGIEPVSREPEMRPIPKGKRNEIGEQK